MVAKMIVVLSTYVSKENTKYQPISPEAPNRAVSFARGPHGQLRLILAVWAFGMHQLEVAFDMYPISIPPSTPPIRLP